LVYSTCLPESVCGTVKLSSTTSIFLITESFLIPRFLRFARLFVPQINITTDFPVVTSLVLKYNCETALETSTYVNPLCLDRDNSVAEYKRLVHRLRHCGLCLGPTNPGTIDVAQETLGFRCWGFSPQLRYSYRHSHFCTLQHSLQNTFKAYRTLPYPSPCGEAVASVSSLSPVTLSAHLSDRTVSCYALFKGWLPLSQPTGCLRKNTTFHTELEFRDLN
jgi:hypothetical protein